MPEHVQDKAQRKFLLRADLKRPGERKDGHEKRERKEQQNRQNIIRRGVRDERQNDSRAYGQRITFTPTDNRSQNRANNPANYRGRQKKPDGPGERGKDEVRNARGKIRNRIAQIALRQLRQVINILLPYWFVQSKSLHVVLNESFAASACAHRRELCQNRPHRVAGHEPRHHKDNRHRNDDGCCEDCQALCQIGKITAHSCEAERERHTERAAPSTVAFNSYELLRRRGLDTADPLAVLARIADDDCVEGRPPTHRHIPCIARGGPARPVGVVERNKRRRLHYRNDRQVGQPDFHRLLEQRNHLGVVIGRDRKHLVYDGIQLGIPVAERIGFEQCHLLPEGLVVLAVEQVEILSDIAGAERMQFDVIVALQNRVLQRAALQWGNGDFDAGASELVGDDLSDFHLFVRVGIYHVLQVQLRHVNSGILEHLQALGFVIRVGGILLEQVGNGIVI